MSDLQTYFQQLGISSSINITAVDIDGGTNNPSDQGASTEVMLDIEVISAVVPKAALRVYFAVNTDQGFYDSIHQAILDGCHLISISWGGPENSWSPNTLSSFSTLFKMQLTKE